MTQQPNCVQTISMHDVVVVGPDGKVRAPRLITFAFSHSPFIAFQKYGSIPNVDKAISINFHDGHVEDEICSEPGDTQHSLNLKRAVASMFQAALNHHHEVRIIYPFISSLSRS